MNETKYNLVDAHRLLGREAARHGDWTAELHAAAATLFRDLATLDQAKLKSVAISAQLGAHLVDPHVLRFDFAGGERVAVIYEDGKLVAMDPTGKRPPLEIELHFNAYTLELETHEGDPAHPGSLRSAAALVIKKVIQQLHET